VFPRAHRLLFIAERPKAEIRKDIIPATISITGNFPADMIGIE
jgi:hypothetical protein